SRNNDFNNSVAFGGQNANNSIADFFSEDASNYNAIPSALPNGSLARMAYDTFLIDEYGDENFYEPSTSLNNTQGYTQMRYGSTSEFNFSGAMNISNQLYIGATVGLVNVRYGYDSQFTESGTNIS